MIIIKTEKVVESGLGRGRKITFIKMKPKHTLPKGYLNSEMNCYSDISILDMHNILINHNKKRTYVNRNKFIKEEEFQKIISLIKKCGENLHQINKKFHAQRQIWNGEEVIKF